MLTSLWTNDINDPNEITSLFAYYPTIQNRRSGWEDQRIDELFEQSQQELDPAKRAAEYKEIQQRYVAAAPIIFGYEVPYPVAMAKKVQGFRADPARQQHIRRHLFVELTPQTAPCTCSASSFAAWSQISVTVLLRGDADVRADAHAARRSGCR